MSDLDHQPQSAFPEIPDMDEKLERVPHSGDYADAPEYPVRDFDKTPLKEAVKKGYVLPPPPAPPTNFDRSPQLPTPEKKSRKGPLAILAGAGMLAAGLVGYGLSSSNDNKQDTVNASPTPELNDNSPNTTVISQVDKDPNRKEYVYTADKVKPVSMTATDPYELLQQYGQNKTVLFNSESEKDRQQAITNMIGGPGEGVRHKLVEDLDKESKMTGLAKKEHGFATEWGKYQFENIEVLQNDGHTIAIEADESTDSGKYEEERTITYFTNYPLADGSDRYLYTGREAAQS